MLPHALRNRTFSVRMKFGQIVSSSIQTVAAHPCYKWRFQIGSRLRLELGKFSPPSPFGDQIEILLYLVSLRFVNK